MRQRHTGLFAAFSELHLEIRVFATLAYVLLTGGFEDSPLTNLTHLSISELFLLLLAVRVGRCLAFLLITDISKLDSTSSFAATSEL